MLLKTPLSLLACVAISLALVACGGSASGPDYDPGETAGSNRNVLNPQDDPNDRLFAGFPFMGGGKKSGNSGIGVNTYLWRATLDTLAFMPLATIDSSGGVIITDWHASPEAPQERFKVTVYILDTRLRADGIKVTVFRQENTGSGGWRDAAVSGDTAASLENAILVRARQLKVDAGG